MTTIPTASAPVSERKLTAAPFATASMTIGVTLKTDGKNRNALMCGIEYKLPTLDSVDPELPSPNSWTETPVTLENGDTFIVRTPHYNDDAYMFVQNAIRQQVEGKIRNAKTVKYNADKSACTVTLPDNLPTDWDSLTAASTGNQYYTVRKNWLALMGDFLNQLVEQGHIPPAAKSKALDVFGSDGISLVSAALRERCLRLLDLFEEHVPEELRSPVASFGQRVRTGLTAEQGDEDLWDI